MNETDNFEYTPHYVVSAPRYKAFRQSFESFDHARLAVARLLDMNAFRMIEVEVEGVTYFYRTQAEADADQDGAYAVKVFYVDPRRGGAR